MRTPLKYLLNPCDMDRLPVLALIGTPLVKLWRGFVYGTDCPCCLGARLIAVAAAFFAVGLML